MTSSTQSAAPDSGYFRLEDQLGWYDRKSMAAQQMYRRLKVLQIVVSAAVPVAALITEDAVTAGALGAVVLVIEGILELGSYRTNWQKYRSTSEALKHEKFMFLASAGPYTDLPEEDARRELAERVEALVSDEHAQWVAQFAKQTKAKSKLA